MKKTIAILLISLMLFISGCAVMTAAAPEPTPAPPTGVLAPSPPKSFAPT